LQAGVGYDFVGYQRRSRVSRLDRTTANSFYRCNRQNRPLGPPKPNFLEVFLRKSLLCNDLLLICTVYCSHVMIFRKFLLCNELRDSRCTQETVGESVCPIDANHCFAITCNQHPPSSRGGGKFGLKRQLLVHTRVRTRARQLSNLLRRPFLSVNLPWLCTTLQRATW